MLRDFWLFCDIASLDLLLPLEVVSHGSRNSITTFPFAISSKLYCSYAIRPAPGNTDRAPSVQTTLQLLRMALRTHLSLLPTPAVAHSFKHWLSQGFSDNTLAGSLVMCREMGAKWLQGLYTHEWGIQRTGIHISGQRRETVFISPHSSSMFYSPDSCQVSSAFQLPSQLCSQSQCWFLPYEGPYSFLFPQ